MSDPLWTDVDNHLAELFHVEDASLAAALEASRAAGLPDIAVSPLQGRFLHVIARAMGARSILEIGTLGGFSTICLGTALPSDGRLISLEAEPHHAEVARASIARAGLANVEVLVGRAQDTLPRLIADGAGPFDLVFIDADKEGYPDYLTWSLELTRPGSLIVADNVVRQGQVIDDGNADSRVQGIRRFLEMLAADSRVSATVLQVVGVKGHDGLAFAVVR